MSQLTREELLSQHHTRDTWGRVGARHAKRKKGDEGGWPAVKLGKLTLKVATEGESDWRKDEPLPPVDIAQRKNADALDEAVRTGKNILRDLDTLREAQDAPDFTRRPTDEAYKAARKSLKAAYTHYVGSAPAPAIAPDGDGGLVVQWKSGKREVRLVVPPGEVEKSYVFSRGDKTAKVDYDISGFVLARQLRSTFAD